MIQKNGSSWFISGSRHVTLNRGLTSLSLIFLIHRVELNMADLSSREMGREHAHALYVLLFFLGYFCFFFFLMWNIFKVFIEFVTILLLFQVLCP